MRSHQRQGLPSLQLQTPSGCLKSAGEISDNIGYFISRHGETRNASIYEVSLICIETCPAPTRLAEITIRFDVITHSHRNLNCVYHLIPITGDNQHLYSFRRAAAAAREASTAPSSRNPGQFQANSRPIPRRHSNVTNTLTQVTDSSSVIITRDAAWRAAWRAAWNGFMALGNCYVIVISSTGFSFGFVDLRQAKENRQRPLWKTAGGDAKQMAPLYSQRLPEILSSFISPP